MSTTIALLLAAFMNAHGTPVKTIENPNGTALVIVEGRPGCTAEALNDDPTTPVISCRKVARR